MGAGPLSLVVRLFCNKPRAKQEREDAIGKARRRSQDSLALVGESSRKAHSRLVGSWSLAGPITPPDEPGKLGQKRLFEPQQIRGRGLGAGAKPARVPRPGSASPLPQVPACNLGTMASKRRRFFGGRTSGPGGPSVKGAIVVSGVGNFVAPQSRLPRRVT
ncbi:hypothetical protein UVI_02003080 [Ustilaginoidea virens]|uniref:Uncharacterized protein n=1 Tax=Ustilaginoidea virens TaxID=1159556 RepID=A0A1B5L267_USTVR|nr:hypothetical protein UVI_02003080 [Ustilaginoidea virens]